ncbi:MAG: cation:proton antiporter [Clostridia bacterium]|nr:cation:proton antiporter [Clostridia bacterium]
MFDGNSTLGFVAVLAIILAFTEVFGLLFHKIGLPRVLGYIVAGILIGPAIFGDFCGYCLIGFENSGYTALLELPVSAEDITGFNVSNALDIFSKIGVLLLMFSTGLETDIKQMRKTGGTALLVALVGVIVPFALGIVISLPFGNIGLGFETPANLYRCIFVGTILTATSVAITVSVLKELGKINTKLGTTIVSAAIIDDVIGIVLLSIVTGIAQASTEQEYDNKFDAFKGTIYGTIIMIVAFFVFAIAAGWVLSKGFKWLDRRWPNHHRIPVFSIAVCFAYAWIADEIFGVADITGAFLAGIVLSTDHRASQYTDKKVDVNTYTLFAPVFFANIGISNITFAGLDPSILLWAFLAVIMGLIGKVVGCGAVFKGFKYNWRESAIGGVGMMARGEVALIITSTVTSSALGEYALPSEFMIMTVLLILFSSILTPILLKVCYKGDKSGLPLGGNGGMPEPLPPTGGGGNAPSSDPGGADAGREPAAPAPGESK